MREAAGGLQWEYSPWGSLLYSKSSQSHPDQTNKKHPSIFSPVQYFPLTLTRVFYWSLFHDTTDTDASLGMIAVYYLTARS